MLINKSKQAYYKRVFKNCKDDSKKIWNKINEIVGRKGKLNIDESVKKLLRRRVLKIFVINLITNFHKR